jgi:hypothetical protein
MTTVQKIEKLLTMRDCDMCYAVPGEHNIIDVINPETGLSWYNGKNLEQIQARYPGAVIMSVDDWSKSVAADQDAPVTWGETTEDRYYEMLEALPPAYMGNLGFLVGEPWDHHVITGQPRFAAYRCIKGKFLESSRPMTIKEFKTLP